MHGHSPAVVTPIEQHHCSLHWVWQNGDCESNASTALTQMNDISGFPNYYQQKNITSTSNHLSTTDAGLYESQTAPLRQAFQRYASYYDLKIK